MKIFTASFFRLSPQDQTAVVDAVLKDLCGALDQVVSPQDRERLERQIKRIQAKAVAFGVYADTEKPPQ